MDVDTVIRSGDVVIRNNRGGQNTESRTTIRTQNNRGTQSDNGNQAVRVTEACRLHRHRDQRTHAEPYGRTVSGSAFTGRILSAPWPVSTPPLTQWEHRAYQRRPEQ
ncbi:MAG: hypothetical protein IPG64_13870 [Haliea sp.]|nr:hypothetical protein [Haliea sp.]